MTKILIVDDEYTNLYLLQVLLTSNGYLVEQAMNGEEALLIARQNPPDLVISDILMPKMDGFNLCREWKDDEKLKFIPFVFYTATYTDIKDEEFALSLGAERFIIKPAEPELFLSIIKETIQDHAAGKLAIHSEPSEEKGEYYREYNEVLVRKLEAKMVQIKRAHLRLAVLYQAISDLAALKPIADLVMIALSAAVEAAGSQKGYFYYYDEKLNTLHFSDGVGFEEEQLKLLKNRGDYNLETNTCLLTGVAKTRKTLNISDVAQETECCPIDDSTRSLLLVPVFHEKFLMGVMVVLSNDINDFDQEDERNLVTLANSLAIAIENARLFDQVQKSELYYRTVLGSSADAIIGFDAAMNITVWNSGGEQAFVYTAREISGRPFEFLFKDNEKARVNEALMRAMQDGSIHGFQTIVVSKDGRHEDVEMTVTYLGPGMGYTAILRVITERKQKEKELETVVDISAALRQADSRSEMVSMILDRLLVMMKAIWTGFDSPDPHYGVMVNELTACLNCKHEKEFNKNCTHQGNWQEIIDTGQSMSFNEADHDERFSDLNLPPDVKAVACAPLIAQNRTIGVLWIAREERINEHDVNMLSSIADMAANAIHRVTLHEQSFQDARELALAYETTIEGWSCALDMRDKETEGHTIRVTDLTLRLARAAGLSEDELVHVKRGALLHDIGKMGIPDTILLKPDKLTDDEWDIMRKHPAYAYELLSPIEYLRPALDIPYCHHEKWDGTGYPRRLKGEEIPLVARLFAVVDVWDALLSDRPYRAACSLEDVRSYIQEQSGKHFDPKAVQLFFQVLEDNDTHW